MMMMMMMMMMMNYLNLEIVWHTVLSDAQYLKLNVHLRAEICSSTVHMPTCLHLCTCLRKGHRIFQKELY